MIDAGLVRLKWISLSTHHLPCVTSGEVTKDKQMSRGHLPSVIYHQVY